MISSYIIFACADGNHKKVITELDSIDNQNTLQHQVVDTVCNNCIDTTEFIFFWEEFQKGFVRKNKYILNHLVADTLLLNCYGKVPEIYNICNSMSSTTIDKNQFIKTLNKINPIYFDLLKKYEIRKDIFQKPVRKPEDVQTRYRCMRINKDEFFAINVKFTDNSSLPVMLMSYSNNSGEINYLTFYFRNINNQIKLFKIESSILIRIDT